MISKDAEGGDALRGDVDVPKVHEDLARAAVPAHAVNTVGAIARRGDRVPAPRLDDDVALDDRGCCLGAPRTRRGPFRPRW